MRKLNLLLAFIPFLLMGFLSSNVITQQGRWRFIGDKNVHFGVDRDVIHVTGNDNYRQLKLKVTNAPVKVMDMKVHFENGDVFDVSIRSRIPQGGESRVIDLPGASRSIKKIEFWYSPAGVLKGTARVAVWGRR